MPRIYAYIQYKNTLDGKPKILREGIDYNTIYNNDLYLSNGETLGKYVAAVEYCRPLLSVEINGKTWIEGEVIERCAGVFILLFGPTKHMSHAVFHYADNDWFEPDDADKLGFFFDNIEKWSRELWGCDEEEGLIQIMNLFNL